MQFQDKIRKSSQYPDIRIKEGRQYDGVDVAFFERDGGAGTDIRGEGNKLIGAYAGLNVFTVGKRIFKDGSPDQSDYLKKVEKNIETATNYIGVDKTKMVVLESQYGGALHAIDRDNYASGSFTEGGVLKKKGDGIMTDDPEVAIACVGADAHPIAIKARKKDSSDSRPVVVCLVVGSHQGLLEGGILKKAVDRMQAVYDIDPDSIQIDIGPGLSPESIPGYNKEQHDYSGASYEVGMDLAMKYMMASIAPDSPYHGKPLKYFNADELTPDKFSSVEEYERYKQINDTGVENTGNPIFRRHPTDPKKCVIDIEALARQTAEAAGIKPDKVHAIGHGNFFSARELSKKIDKQEMIKHLAAQKEIPLEEFVVGQETVRAKEALKTALYDRVGRNLIIARVMQVAGVEEKTVS